jgi:hypothetical protein
MAHLDTNPGASNSSAIKATHSVLRVSRIVKLDKGKAGRVSCHPDVSQRAILAERTLDVDLGRAFTQITDIHLAIHLPILVMSFPLGHELSNRQGR